MRLRSEARVGLIITAAIAVLIGIYWFLGGLSLRRSAYPVHAIFSNALKLDKGSDVRMAGVKIGIVEDVRLTRESQARVDLLVWNGTKVPSDSIARITTGALIGENYVDIIPGASNENIRSGQRIRARQLPQFEEIVCQADQLLAELRVSAKGINEIIGDEKIIATMKDTIKALDVAANRANSLIAAAEGVIAGATPGINRALDNIVTATAEIAEMNSELLKMVKSDGRPGVKTILERTATAVDNLNTAIVGAQKLIDGFKSSSSQIDTTLGKVSSAATQAEQMMTRLNEASGGIRDLATDQELKACLKDAVKNAAEASAQAKELMTSLNRKFGGTGGGKAMLKSEVPEGGTSINTLWNTDRGEYRVDANYTHPAGGGQFYRAGLYDLGENTRVNAQAGTMLNYQNALRYGLYASRVGLGYDFMPRGNFVVSGDVFDPNDPRMEVRGVLRIGDVGLYGGVQDILNKDDRDLLIGIRYQK